MADAYAKREEPRASGEANLASRRNVMTESCAAAVCLLPAYNVFPGARVIHRATVSAAAVRLRPYWLDVVTPPPFPFTLYSPTPAGSFSPQ